VLNIKGNKRLENETFKAYKKRVKSEAKKVKTYLRGRLVWLATDIRDHWGNVLHEGQGTYRRDLHGELPRG
jgi:hypothetical protein